jgi:anthranilate phosphoribosyltransferase
MKYAIGPRREIGVRTVFNILGPLTNPAGAGCQVLGVYDDKLVSVLAGVLKNLGSKRCMVVHGEDGLDEMTVTGATHVAELKGGVVETYTLVPEDLGLRRASLSDLVVQGPDEAADALRGVLNGATGHKRDIVVLNAGAAILVAGAADDLEEGMAKAVRAIDSGAAAKALETLVRVSTGG